MRVERTKKYQTVTGSRVRIFATDGGGVYTVLGAVEVLPGIWAPRNWSIEGRSPDNPSDNLMAEALIFTEQRIHGLYRTKDTGEPYTIVHKSDDTAADARVERICLAQKRISLTITEGEFCSLRR